jgi:hypothetical protein
VAEAGAAGVAAVQAAEDLVADDDKWGRSDDSLGLTVRIQATGPTLSVVVQMDASVKKGQLRHALVDALAPFLADVLENGVIQEEDWLDQGGSTSEGIDKKSEVSCPTTKEPKDLE